MRYVVETYKEKMSELAYRIYISDALMVIGRFKDAERYYDKYQEIMVFGNRESEEEQKEEATKIINNIKDKLGKLR